MALKKLISACLLPFPFALLFVVVGVTLLWFTQRQRLGRACVTFGTLWLLVGGYDLLSRPLIGPLEHQYAPLAAAQVTAMTPAPVAVVVLGSGYYPDPSTPPNDRLSTNGLARLIEGVRLVRLLPAARLIVSDGIGQGEALAETAVLLGVPRDRVVREPHSMDTSDEAALLPAMVGGAPFLLVTSAAHMRRSMALCQKQGLNPIAAPTDYIGSSSEFTASDLVPSAGGFGRTDRALHEYIGIWWSKLRGTI